jgi:hypothetical protein
MDVIRANGGKIPYNEPSRFLPHPPQTVIHAKEICTHTIYLLHLAKHCEMHCQPYIYASPHNVINVYLSAAAAHVQDGILLCTVDVERHSSTSASCRQVLPVVATRDTIVDCS